MEALLKDDNEMQNEDSRSQGYKPNVPSKKNIIFNSYVSNYGARPKGNGKITSNSEFENWLFSFFFSPDSEDGVETVASE